MIKRMITLGLGILILTAVLPQIALGVGIEPAAARWSVAPLAEVGRHLSPDLDQAALDREDLDRLEQGLPYRFATVQDVELNPEVAGTWEDLPFGRSLWRLRVSSRDVLSLNLGFTRFQLPQGAHLLVYPASGEGPVQVYDASDNEIHGELWTPVMLTDDAVVELEVDSALRWQVELELTSIGRGYRFFGEDPAEKSGACNIDVICPQGDDWRDEIDSVGVYSFGGGTLCTGFMTNNTAEDGTPYFMTAYHCNVRSSVAPSVVVYWNFQSPSCGQHGGGSYDESQTGSTLRAEYQTTDVTLLELDDLPDPASHVKYAGWNRGSTVASSAVCIHHPNTDEKSISFEDDPLTVTTYQSLVSPGDGTHLMVRDWDEGTTERGSSGSPLFDQDHYVIGQLHGGAAACGNNEPDWYGWFHISWLGGGTPESRLNDWLDPLGTGATTVETIDPFGSSFEFTPTEGFVTSGVYGGPFEPAEMVYTLTNTGTEIASFTASVQDTWLMVTPTSGFIPVGSTATVTVGLAEKANVVSVGTHQSALEILNSGHGSGTTSRPVTLTVYANIPTIIGAAPNPFGSATYPETRIRYTLGGAATARAWIHSIRGELVKDLGSMAGVAGENHFLWDGTGPGGAKMASGPYVFIMEAAGREVRTSLMLIK